MLFQIDHRSSRLAALLSELFCLLSLPLVLALISLQQLQYDSLIHILLWVGIFNQSGQPREEDLKERDHLALLSA
jgi:hypothetical protein